jgi:rhodanese-related sulfurtransferase
LNEPVDMANLECGGQELYERVEAGETICIVDVRTMGEVAGGVIPNALHIPLHQLEVRWQELENEDEVVLYCAAGMRSFNAAMLLRQKGILNATSLAGGLPAWSGAGGPIGKLAE